MRRVLVTGAGGYVGTVLVPMLLEAGYAVRALDRFFFGEDLLPEHPALERVKADLRRLEPAHLAGIDSVIDLAAISNDPSGEQFQEATRQINHLARARCAGMAKAAGVKRYILPSSASIYGWQAAGVICDETGSVNPLTIYARANRAAEEAVLPLADKGFCVVVLRQATLFGLSPRMRFDLAINGMTLGAWETGMLPLMRDGRQWRPMVHVRDAAEAQRFMLEAPAAAVNGRIFNVGAGEGNLQLGPLAERIRAVLPRAVEISWYGDPDGRSYRCAFERIERLGWRAARTVEDGVREIWQALEEGRVRRTPQTITLGWYQELIRWQRIVRAAEIEGAILDLPGTTG